MKTTATLLALVMGAALFGCQREQAAPEVRATETATMSTEAPVDPAEIKLAAEDPIPVTITDEAIEVGETETIPGPTEIQVMNESSRTHSLVIEGAGGRTELPRPLDPQQVETMVVDFRPGTYRIHVAEPGFDALSAEIVVRPAEPES
ncbi:MAG TPA: hypothetical protein VMS56_10755 [Thermoanaerobaculia bacterium]|nr:hypothetical protein [Thermoanaerobaculia bacterium]